MEEPLSLHLVTSQVLKVSFSAPMEALMAIEVAKAREMGRQAAEVANRTYHMGSEPTPGRGYDDRLTMRINQSATTCYNLIKLGFKNGGIDAQQVGNRWYITEEAVRDFEGRRKQAA